MRLLAAMKKMKLLPTILLVIVCLLINNSKLKAQIIKSSEIDELVEKTLKTFDVPGMAVAIIKDGKVIHSKGYGVRSLITKEKVDENTLFGIASNSKAYTAAALAMLVDDKKIKWDDKVTDYIPEFQMSDPYITKEFTIRDLLTHRCGLGLGAGDLMIWPDSNTNTTNDVIHNLRYLKPVSSFRSQYDYDNNMFIVAGEVLARVSGMSWDDFIEKKIMQPLNMTKSAASKKRLKDKSNITALHAPVDGKVQVINIGWSEIANAAGGIYSNLTDLSKWLTMQLNKGKYGDNLSSKLFSEEVQNDMWNLQTIIPVNKPGTYNTHFSGYGLGWFLSDVKGYKQVTHTGGLAGTVTQITLIPELNLGIIVLTNQQVGAAFTTITNTIKDSYFGMPKTDRLKEYADRWTKGNENAKKIVDEVEKVLADQQKNMTPKIDVNLFTGTYTDKWFGDGVISIKNGKLWFDSKKSARLTGELLYYKANTFVVKWTERGMDADAFLQFNLDKDGKAVSFKMEAISPLTDFSFDFQELDFNRADY